MAQAKTLTVRELRKVLDHLPVNKYRSRNRLMLLMTHWSGMRVGEVAALSMGDVRNVDDTVKDEIRLDATQTKGKHARTVFVNDRLIKVDKNNFGFPIVKVPNGRLSIENSTVELPLKAGDNVLMMALGGNFFSWGIVARLDDMEGLVIER